MKTLVAALLLTSFSASASYLKMSTCTGKSADGYELNFSVYVEEDFYCVEKEKYQGVVVDEMFAMPATITSNESGEVNVSANADLGRVSRTVFELIFDEYYYPEVQKAKVRLLSDDETTFEESELTCQN